MIFDILGNNVEFDDELVSFVKKLFEFEAARDRVIKDVGITINSNNILEAIKYLDAELKKEIKRIIAELSTYGVYDKIEEDFIGGNTGYTALIEAFNKYMDISKRISDKHNSNAEVYLDKEEKIAKSKIAGLDFGIITNDFLSLWIYDSMNQATIRKETEKAYKNYTEIVNRIATLTQTNIENEAAEYRKNVLIPSVNNAITEFFSILFAQYMELLSQNGRFKLSCVENIDEKRAKALLENVKVVEEPEKLIANSIGMCPYRIEAYLLAEDLGIFTSELARCCKMFFQAENFEQQVIDTYLIKDGSKICISPSYDNLEKHLYSIKVITGVSERDIFKNIISENIEHIENSIMNFISTFVNNTDKNRRLWISFNTKGVTKKEIEEEILVKLDTIINKSDYKCLKEKIEYDLFERMNLQIAPMKILGYEEFQAWVLSQVENAIVSYVEDKNKEIQEKECEVQKQKEIQLQNKKMMKYISIIIIFVVVILMMIRVFPGLHENYLDAKQYKDAVKKYGEFLGGFETGLEKNEVDSLFDLLYEDGSRSFYEVTILGVDGELEVDYKNYSSGNSEAVSYTWRSEENVSVETVEWFVNCCDQYYVREQYLLKEESVGSHKVQYNGNGSAPYVYVSFNRGQIIILYMPYS